MVSHIAEVYDPKDPRFSPYWAMLANGQIGVAIFVISGFLITNLLLKELDGTGGLSLHRFYICRAFRILPAYYAFLLAILASAQLHWIFLSRKEFVSSLAFVWNYVPSSNSWWLGHTWSLCVEEQFYFLWPVALVTLGRERAWRMAIWIVALSPVLRIVAYFMLPAFRSKLTFFLSSRADALMIGCVLALCASEPWFLRLWDSIGSARVASACAAFIFIGSPALFSRFHFAYQMTLGYSLEVLCIGVILYWCVENPKMERPALEARKWFLITRRSNTMQFLLPEDVTKRKSRLYRRSSRRTLSEALNRWPPKWPKPFGSKGTR
jgi:peptidoglycan/LPS O-acetylase OafA/YrhL